MLNIENTTVGMTPVSAQAASAAWASNVDVLPVGDGFVPVGEHSPYKVDDERWNVSANPRGHMLGDCSAGVSRALNDDVALRVDVHFAAPYKTDWGAAGLTSLHARGALAHGMMCDI